MSSARITFTREYLQGVPEQRKQQHIDAIVGQFQGELVATAASGKTSYMYCRPDIRGHVNSCNPNQLNLTDEELILGFQTRFPGCKVSYEESWVDTGRDTRTLKKGIVIDWS